MAAIKAPKIFAHQLSRPENNIANYEDSRRFCRPPKSTIKNRDAPPVNHKLERFKAHCNLRVLNEDLRRSRINYEWMHRGFRMECGRLFRMAKLLKKEIRECDVFVVENEEKRRRFRLKMEQARQTAKQKTEETEKMRTNIIFLKKIKKQMEDKIAEYDFYEAFLNGVAAENPFVFKNAASVVRR